jgi:MYXO-CTERM domain-containing protein
MKRRTLLALAGGASMLMTSNLTEGALIGLHVEQVQSGGGSPPHINPLAIYHVFAEFTDGADRVLAWGIGGNSFGAGGIENLNPTGTGPGFGFHNVGAATAGTPSSAGSTRDWDTYATLGVRYLSQLPAGADAPAYSPGFPAFIIGTSLAVPDSGMAAFITPDPINTHGRADFINEGADDANRVLLMQLVVRDNDHVSGTIGLVWDTTGAGGVVASGLSFTTVPAPGALALLGLAGLVGSRRRRA